LRFGLLSVLVFVCAAGPAQASESLLSLRDVTGMLDLRASAADGEASWLQGGFGKTRVGGASPGWAGHASIANASVAWTPHLTWDFSAVLVGQYQSDHDHAPALGEAYVAYKPAPRGDTRWSARLGLYYPPISQEHQGPAWIDADMLTPSAINSWIGEEVKVVGAEASIRHQFGEQEVAVTAGVFGFNDTSGTLLTTRGWALGDVTIGYPGSYKLPPLSEFMEYAQAPITTPVMEIDNRVGGYGRLDVRLTDRFALNAFYYDNFGNLIGENHYQWAWKTQFWNFGASLDLGDRTRVLSQVLIGSTRMGYAYPTLWVATNFDAAYVLVTHKIGSNALSGRIDVFQTRNLAEKYYGETQEHGWALTADYRHRLTGHANVLVEAIHVSSCRPAREDILGQAARQDQNVVQAALRLSF
jgi:hypothetical protein